jgi:hypothetical protein
MSKVFLSIVFVSSGNVEAIHLQSRRCCERLNNGIHTRDKHSSLFSIQALPSRVCQNLPYSKISDNAVKA